MVRRTILFNGDELSATVVAIASSEQIDNQLELVGVYAGAGIAGILLFGIGIIIMIVGGIFLVFQIRKKISK